MLFPIARLGIAQVLQSVFWAPLPGHGRL